jgi:O-antigen ligase
MVGLSVTVWLRYIAQPLADRRAWRSILLAVGMVVSLVATVLVFQRFTGAAITTQAVERSRTFVDYQRDVMVLSRLLGYARALDVIAERPILGSGQGKTLTFYSFNPETNKFETWTSWTMDSLYLALWLKMGLPGLLAFGWLCIHVLRTAWKSFRGSADPRVQAFMSGAIAVLVANLVLGVADGSMVTGRFAVVFGVLFGMVEVVARQSAARVAAGPEAEARGAPGRVTVD